MAPKPKGNVTAAMALATAHAVRLLQDPETRAQLLKAGSDATRHVRSWYSERQQFTDSTNPGGSAKGFDDVIDEDGRSVGLAKTSKTVRLRRPASLFAQERLERRTVKLASTLDVLRSSLRLSDTAALDGVDEAIMRIHLALKVAANLPFPKRAKAHHEISVTLGALESAVMDAVLRDTNPG
ncbi:MAG TPA: hypothetical protein VL068_14630 [Microthrixaceae bacterium]|nr:hypothetical protein [Microthrixaceae bacterium]